MKLVIFLNVFNISGKKGTAMEPLYIRLWYFSGRPDPICKIDSGHPEYENIISMLPSSMTTCRDCFSGLGYKGFTVRLGRDGTSQDIPRFSNPTLEMLLLNSCSFPDRVKDRIRKGLEELEGTK